MKSWLRQQGAALTDALRHMLKARGNFALNVLVVAIALALPFAGLTALENMRPVSEQISAEPEISLFMAMDTPRDKALALAVPIRRVVQDGKSSAKLEFMPRENALAALKKKTGLSDALTAIGGNPLPDAYVVKLASFENASDAAKVDAIAAQLKALPGIEFVQVDSTWVKRLAALLNVMRMVLVFMAVTLGVVVVAVIFNTVRLQVMTQREEIEIMRLLGATDRYIYRPFYYSGALLGLCAGGLALGAVTLGLQPLNGAIAEFAHLYASEFRLMSLNVETSMLLLALSATLGLVGALLSVQRHLARLA